MRLHTAKATGRSHHDLGPVTIDRNAKIPTKGAPTMTPSQTLHTVAGDACANGTMTRTIGGGYTNCLIE